MIERVDHIGIVVKDLSKALAIYSNGFGLQPKEMREIKDVPLKVAVFQVGAHGQVRGHSNCPNMF